MQEEKAQEYEKYRKRMSMRRKQVEPQPLILLIILFDTPSEILFDRIEN